MTFCKRHQHALRSLLIHAWVWKEIRGYCSQSRIKFDLLLHLVRIGDRTEAKRSRYLPSDWSPKVDMCDSLCLRLRSGIGRRLVREDKFAVPQKEASCIEASACARLAG